MKKFLTFLTFFAVAGIPFQLATAEEKKPIFDRLGGARAIDAAVDAFYVKVLADKRVNHFFEDINMSKQHKKQKAFLMKAFGGPDFYLGQDMREGHKHLDLKEEDFNVIAGHLVATLQELGVDKCLIDEVVAVALTTKDDVLNRPKKK